MSKALFADHHRRRLTTTEKQIIERVEELRAEGESIAQIAEAIGVTDAQAEAGQYPMDAQAAHVPRTTAGAPPHRAVLSQEPVGGS
jgi:hypothetical protein